MLPCASHYFTPSLWCPLCSHSWWRVTGSASSRCPTDSSAARRVIGDREMISKSRLPSRRHRCKTSISHHPSLPPSPCPSARPAIHGGSGTAYRRVATAAALHCPGYFGSREWGVPYFGTNCFGCPVRPRHCFVRLLRLIPPPLPLSLIEWMDCDSGGGGARGSFS